MPGFQSIRRRLGLGSTRPTPPQTPPPQPEPEPQHQVLRPDQRNDVDREFKLARLSGPEQWHAEAEVREWAAAKPPTTATGEAPLKDGGFYRVLRDPYEIRVLEVLPGKGDEMLRCRLVHCSIEFELKFPKVRYALSMEDLTQPVWYTALSYVWGKPVFEAEIGCEGQPLMITRSLEAALRRFRLPECSGFLWIDQICIDQKDLREKERQIPLMSHIYEHALNTIVWLGEGSPESDLAMKFLSENGSGAMVSDFSDEVDPGELEAMGFPSADNETWVRVWELLSRPWFTRVWVIQEVILSRDPWVFCGQSCLLWKVLFNACDRFINLGASRWVMQRLARSDAVNRPTGDWHLKDVFESIVTLSYIRNAHQFALLHSEKVDSSQSLLGLLMRTRSVECYDARDRIYGLLGICADRDKTIVSPSYAEECTAAHQFHALAVHGMAEGGLWGAYRVLACVDDEPSPDLPSWVPDWRKPPQTKSLGASISVAAIYGAEPDAALYALTEVEVRGKNKEELCPLGFVTDTVAVLSDVFGNPELSYVNPDVENETLIAAVAFVVQNSGQIAGFDAVFEPFWRTLVANRDDESRRIAPPYFAEIFSLLLDASTGLSPTLPGQTYSDRQTRPWGQGRLEPPDLGSIPEWTAFQEARVAMINGLRNRRLGVTVKGRLGLFPRHAKVGDTVCVLRFGYVPFLLRPAEQSGKYRLLGDCFVYGIMNGEAVIEEKARLDPEGKRDKSWWPGEVLVLV